MNNENSNLSDDDEPALDLDINVLQQFVSSCLNRCYVRIRILTRGLNNEVYLLQSDAGTDCIVRLSRDIIHPPGKFISEVATIKYVSQNTCIKVPESVRLGLHCK
ncbi:hypothetical protein RclHR1_00210027 [Rhizophagus clarus]|uniref:Aminoglycoside phosphotransferase domain-containing protein n=1 Tax=Rhizophagus clarus TaxID=94130 RepID=A0A2Z6R7U4_9GLOM|nr:hypothetical protein RclHR1_00210027 [Rhizophagus clarus]